MIAWFVHNKVAANLLMVSILLGGLISLKTHLPLEILPHYEPEEIKVSVDLLGATPDEVEKGVSTKIEEAVQDLEGIKHILSVSTEGNALINVELERGVNARDLLVDIKSRVDAINTFPAATEKPVIYLEKHKRQVIMVSVASIHDEKETRSMATRIRDDLLRIKGITQVEFDTVRQYQVNIHVHTGALQQYHLTLDDVVVAINEGSLDMSAGNIKTDGGNILVRNKAQAYQRHEFEKVVVQTRIDGTFLHLSDIAEIDDSFEEDPVSVRLNGKPTVLLSVFRVGNQSAINVANSVKQYIEKQQRHLPDGFELRFWADRSEFLQKRINTLINNAIQGGLLVLLLLTLFLQPLVAFWVFLGIPVSFCGAFILMPLLGVSINVMSVFGFILVLGIVVDDAIVTGENIYRHSRTAQSGEQAAIDGAEEVAIPVTFGVLTTVVAFIPLAFIEGYRGAIFAQLPLIIIPVLFFSLIESKLVLPAHLSRLSMRLESQKTSAFTRWQSGFSGGVEGLILKYYQPLLEKALRYRAMTLALFMSLFILVAAMVFSGWIHFTFFPRIPSEVAKAELTMPAGTRFSVLDAEIERIQSAALYLQDKYRDKQGDSLIMNILAVSSGDKGSVHFQIISSDQIDTGVTMAQLASEWREIIGEVPGARSFVIRAELGRAGEPIDIELISSDSLALEQVTEKMTAKLATYSAVFDITENLSGGKQEIQIHMKPEGHAMGLSNLQVTQQVKNAFYGAEAQRIQRGRDDVRVKVNLPKSERQSIAQLNDYLIETRSGKKVPLSHVALLTTTKSPSAIYHYDRHKTVNVIADVDKSSVNMQQLNQELIDYLDTLKGDYPTVEYHFGGEIEELSESLGSLITGLFGVIFIMYCLLAIPLKSYIQPVIVMSVIPFAAVGAIMGHWVMRMDLSFMSLLGGMALVGVVINDALVLVDYINKKHATGIPIKEAVLTAGIVRFRPVLLTSLTTFVGLLPLLVERSTQAQFLIPMAVSLAFGIVLASFITLFLVPINFLLVEDLKKSVGHSTHQKSRRLNNADGIKK